MAIPGIGAAAAAAYGAVQRMPGSALTEDTGSADDSGFGAALQNAATSLLSSGASADAAASTALQGKGDVTEVVMAVSRAELALQTTVAIRDRIVAAYQDVMRMSI